MTDTAAPDRDLTDQEGATEDICTFEARMRKALKERRTVGWLKTNLDLLNQQWADFKTRHRALARKPELKGDAVLPHEDDHSQRTLTGARPDDNRSRPGRGVSSIRDALLSGTTPELQLPKFSGNHLEWEAFKEMFLALVHNVAKIPPVLKLQYLVGALSGEAAIKIKNIKITAINYDGVWQSLLKKYDNKRLLISAHMSSYPAQQWQSSPWKNSPALWMS